jgi:hypothetical protein
MIGGGGPVARMRDCNFARECPQKAGHVLMAGFFSSRHGNKGIFGNRGIPCRFAEGFGFRLDRVVERPASPKIAQGGGMDVSAAMVYGHQLTSFRP